MYEYQSVKSWTVPPKPSLPLCTLQPVWRFPEGSLQVAGASGVLGFSLLRLRLSATLYNSGLPRWSALSPHLQTADLREPAHCLFPGSVARLTIRTHRQTLEEAVWLFLSVNHLAGFPIQTCQLPWNKPERGELYNSPYPRGPGLWEYIVCWRSGPRRNRYLSSKADSFLGASEVTGYRREASTLN